MGIKLCRVVFGVLLGLFLVAVTPMAGLLQLHGDFRNFVLPFGVLGAALITLALKTKMGVMLKVFLLGNGISATGWLVSLYLHGLLTQFFPTEPVTYILFFYVFTPAFIVSSAGVLIIGIRHMLSSN
ncbi:MAG: hypothetical protein Q7J73_03370 [Dehalococcoidales bacterium]|nr:hypothetical protein [Dehalococcoidales bacterium]